MRMREGTDEAFITILLQDRTPAICPEDLGRGQGQLQGHPSCSHAQKGPMLDLRLCCYHLEILVVQSLSRVQCFCDTVDHSPPDSSVHGSSQARTLEWVAISSFTGSSQPRDRTCVSCLAGRFFTTEPPGKR